jgi:hypothetical protein
MRTEILKVFAAGVVGLALLHGARAQEGQPATGELKAFAAQYVAALNSKDTARLLALQNSKSAACMTAENKDYYDFVLTASTHEKVPANYTAAVMPVHEGNLKALESMGQQWPIRPAKEMHINYQQGDDVGSVIVYLVQQDGKWMGDFPCPTDATVKDFRDSQAARQAAMTHYRELANSIKDPLRGELVGLLRAHETGTATDRYHAATGEDMKTSMLVIDQLKSQIQ